MMPRSEILHPALCPFSLILAPLLLCNLYGVKDVQR